MVQEHNAVIIRNGRHNFFRVFFNGCTTKRARIVVFEVTKQTCEAKCVSAWSGREIFCLVMFLLFQANGATIFWFFFFFFFCFFFFLFFLFFLWWIRILITNASNHAVAPCQRAQFEVIGDWDDWDDINIAVVAVAVVVVVAASIKFLNRCHEND